MLENTIRFPSDVSVVVQPNGTAVKLSWTNLNQDNFQCLFFRKDGQDWQFVFLMPTTSSYLFTRLKANTHYEFRLVSGNARTFNVDTQRY